MPMTHHLQHIIAAEASAHDVSSQQTHCSPLPLRRGEGQGEGSFPGSGSPVNVPNTELQRLQDRIAEFQEANFPTQTLDGKLTHLVREANELRGTPEDVMEWADVLILLLGAAHKRCLTAQDLINAARIKLRINEQRQWPAEPDAEGVYHHLEP
jgi:hypothetical protein